MVNAVLVTVFNVWRDVECLQDRPVVQVGNNVVGEFCPLQVRLDFWVFVLMSGFLKDWAMLKAIYQDENDVLVRVGYVVIFHIRHFWKAVLLHSNRGREEADSGAGKARNVPYATDFVCAL